MIFKILVIAYICLLIACIFKLEQRIKRLEENSIDLAQKLLETIEMIKR